VRSDRFIGSAYGDELVSLTARGEQVASLLVSSARSAVDQQTAAARVTDPQMPSSEEWREVELLQKLGELADRQGDFKAASAYYQQALEALRKIKQSG